MRNTYLIYAILVMAGVTYIIRALPLTLFRKRITNPYVKSFLNFVPYSVLGAMTIPDAFFATGSLFSATVGIIAALILSLKGKGLLLTSLFSCAVVFLADLIISVI